MAAERLGWPGRWYNGHLYDDGGLPLHLYPFPVTADGRGPCDASDPAYDHDVCWCHFDGCMGDEDAFGFPAIMANGEIDRPIVVLQ